MTAVETMTVFVGPEGNQVLPADADEHMWLAARSSGVGASEVAAVLGESSYDSPYSLWARKTGRVEPDAKTAVQKRGHRFEQAIADTFADHHPEYEVFRVGLVRHHQNGWELATPDRELFANDEPAGLLELKTAGFGKAAEWGDEGTDDIPVAYSLQCQWQMAVTGYPYVQVAVMFSLDDYREYLVRRDEDVIAYLRGRVYEFWHEHVLADVPPPVDGHEATTTALRRLPASGGAVDIGPEAMNLCLDYWRAHADLAEAEQRKNQAGNRLRELLAGAEAGTWGEQTWVTNKMQRGKTSFDIKRFQVDHPDLAAEYVIRGQDYPVLRPRKAHDA